MCPSRLRGSTQVVTESTAVLFDTRSACDGADTQGIRAACPVRHTFQHVPALGIGGILRGDWGHTGA